MSSYQLTNATPRFYRTQQEKRQHKVNSGDAQRYCVSWTQCEPSHHTTSYCVWNVIVVSWNSTTLETEFSRSRLSQCLVGTSFGLADRET